MLPNPNASVDAAIAALEQQRELLGDAVVDAALASLRRQRVDAPPVQPADQWLKPVTVMFVDIVGSTAMARQLDPEDVHAVMDGALRCFTDLVQRHGGRVLQYAGDGLLAAFGADEVHEDDAVHAVQAGLEITQAARQLGAPGTDFSVRVGLDSGPVLLGGGVGPGSIRGHVVNLAARMEQSAPPGGLRISQNTWRLVRGSFDIGPAETLQVKGVDVPVRSHLVLRSRPSTRHQPARGVDGLETPLVGRDAEIARLRSAWQAFGRAEPPVPQTWAVVGDAGIGKSRVLAEFGASAIGGHAGARVIAVGALQPLQNEPWSLLRALLLTALSIDEADAADPVRLKLPPALATVLGSAGIDADDAHEQACLAAHLLGFDQSHSPHLSGILGDAAQIRARASRAVIRALRQVVQGNRGPVLVCLDDLHWADDASLDVIDSWIGSMSGTRLMVLAGARPSWLERRPQGLSAAQTTAAVELSPLDASERDVLAGSLLARLDAVPDELRLLVTQGCDGNPFFMEEMVNMLLDEGGIAPLPNGRWHLVPDRLKRIDVPRTLAGVMQARLDSLSARERAALQQAAVIGYVFWDQAVAALDEHSPAVLDPLVQRQLVVPQARSALLQAREFNFQHHLLQQQAYESMLRRDRRTYHARAAAWLQSLRDEGGAELDATLAHHHECAGNTDAAVQAYTRAAEAAAARDASDAALGHAAHALALLGASSSDVASRWRLALVREAMLGFRAEAARHDEVLSELVDLAQQLGDAHCRAIAALRLGLCHEERGDYPLAEREALLALECAGADATLLADSRALLSRAQRRMGRFAEARATAELGLAQASGAAPQAHIALMTALDGVLSEQGELLAGKAARESALALARACGDRFGELLLTNNLGDVLVRLGDYAAAADCFSEALRLADQYGRRDRRALAHLNLAALALLRGDAESAAELGERAARESAAVGAHDLLAAADLPRGLALLALGRLDQASVALRRSRDRFVANAGPHLALEPTAGLALVELARGDAGVARRVLQPVLEHLDAGGSFDGTEEPLRIRLQCWQVLQACGDAHAADVLASAHAALIERAQRIDRPADRERFLREVPHHRALLEAAAACASMRAAALR